MSFRLMKKQQQTDEADIIIRSLESRVAKMEKSDTSALNFVLYRFA